MGDSIFHHHHQNTKWGNIFQKTVVYPSSKVPHTLSTYDRERTSSCGGKTPYTIKC